MSMLGTVTFRNDQGHLFDFKIYPMDASFKPGHGAVYVITRRNDGDKGHHGHHIVYIGETDDMATALASHPEQSLFEAEQANCCCVHATQDSAARTRIAGELQAKYLSSR